MAFTKNILLSVFVISFSFVENAPSNTMYKILGNDLHSRLVFESRHGETSTSNSQLPANQWSTTAPVIQKRRLPSAEQITEPVFAPNDPPQAVNEQTSTTSGLKRMEDERQNWGFVIEDKDVIEEESYYNRPLNLQKVVVNKVNVTKPAKVGIKAAANVLMQPSACDTAVITCCAKPSAIKQCFVSVGCPNISDDMFKNLCSNDNIKKVIQAFARYYKGTENK